jgi:predicted transcriptional regulator
MPKKSPIARISITIPADTLEMADELAARLDRPRSWVIGEAVRRWAPRPSAVEPPATVREPAAAPYVAHRPGLGESRLAQLRADMAMSVDARVLAAEEVTQVDRLTRPSAPRHQLTCFDRFEDYLAWKKYEGIRS